MESEPQAYMTETGMLTDAMEKIKFVRDYVNGMQDRLNALEAERDELKQYVDDLLDRPTYTVEYEQLRKASYDMTENYKSIEAERDRLRELVKQAYEYMCETGEAPIHLAKQFKAIKGGGDETR